MQSNKKILFVTDLYYPAKGRVYYLEDLWLTERLRQSFALSICHPRDMQHFADTCDLTVIRNAGPAANFKDQYLEFRRHVAVKKLKTYNSFNGQGDMNGKDYLLALTEVKLAVIPTIDDIANLGKLPPSRKYVVKPKDGADSHGLEIVGEQELPAACAKLTNNLLIQPLIEFQYEVSFYFIDRQYQYAFYAPDITKRWQLQAYEATEADITFATTFIDWNNLDCGITRVDACRTADGALLLVELEDLNPFLSLLDLPEEKRERFVASLTVSLHRALD